MEEKLKGGPSPGQGNPELKAESRVDLKAATAFLDWLTAVDKGQKLIAGFGRERFGAPLFVPESRAWKARQP